MSKKDIPFDAWQLIQAKEIIKWFRANLNFSMNSLNTLELVESILFDEAYSKLGLKPISKCTIQELQDIKGNQQPYFIANQIAMKASINLW